MCGVCAILPVEQQATVETAVWASRYRDMLSAQAHRGPDGAGVALWQAGVASPITSYAATPPQLAISQTGSARCLLGHNWLAIQDQAHEARQPMLAGDLALVFNGEIYNFLELRQELQQQGETFTTNSDTEVLLKLWQRQGPACLTQLRGMFAFLIYDAKAQVLWAARDPFGIKPLYQARIDGSLCFASEMRALHAAGASRAMRPSAVLACVAAAVNQFGERETLYEEIAEVPPGTLMRVDHVGITERRFFTFDDPVGGLAGEEATNSLRRELTQSVRLHLRSTRKIATCLSGGLDSANLAWLIGAERDAAGADFTTYTICSAQARSSEIELARLVAQKADLPHEVYDCDPEIDPADVLEMALAYETPNHTVGPINQFLLLRQIAASGASVVLDGQGGDELVSGYPWFWPVLIKAIEAKGGDTSALREQRAGRLPLRPEIAAMFDERFHNPLAWIGAVMGESFLGVSARDVLDLQETQYYLAGGGDWARFRQRAYFRGELQYLLRQEDRLGMWFGLECRVPYVDRALVALAGRFDPEYLIREAYLKYPYRVLLPEVPEEIRWRTRKQGFWDTDPKRYGWMQPLARELALGSPLLRSLLPRLEADFATLNFNQHWRLAQIGVLERCRDRGDVSGLLNGVKFDTA